VAFHNWTFWSAPSFVLGTNTVLLACLLYRSGLVPRFIPVLGLVGGPLVFASGAAQMFGLYKQISVWAAITAVPGVRMGDQPRALPHREGFRPSAAASLASTVDSAALSVACATVA